MSAGMQDRLPAAARFAIVIQVANKGAIGMRYAILALVVTSSLAACGGGSNRAPVSAPVAQFASGPIGNACLIGGRKSASRALCGCVQAAADISLNAADQRRGARFFVDSAAVQDMQLSDTPAAEAFWDRWKAFSELAKGMCTTV